MDEKNVSADYDSENGPNDDGQTEQPQNNQDLLARATRAEQRAAQLERELEATQPYVQFPPQQQQQEEEGSPVTTPAPKAQTPNEVEGLRNAVGELKLELFYSRNQDLEKHKDLFVGAFMQTDDRKPPQQRLDEAAKRVRDKVKALREEALAEQKAEQDKVKKAAAATAGIMDGGSTPPQAPDKEEGWSNEEYATARRKRQQEIYGTG